jgi:hypothetical protein
MTLVWIKLCQMQISMTHMMFYSTIMIATVLCIHLIWEPYSTISAKTLTLTLQVRLQSTEWSGILKLPMIIDEPSLHSYNSIQANGAMFLKLQKVSFVFGLFCIVHSHSLRWTWVKQKVVWNRHSMCMSNQADKSKMVCLNIQASSSGV